MILGPVGYQNFSMGMERAPSELGRELRCAVSPLPTRKMPSSVRLDVCRVTGSEVGLLSAFCIGDSVMGLQPARRTIRLESRWIRFMVNRLVVIFHQHNPSVLWSTTSDLRYFF